MRLALGLLVLVPAVAAAQPAEPVPGALPPIGLPLPRIGLSLPPIGLRPAVEVPRDDHRGDSSGWRRARRGLHVVTPLIVLPPCALVVDGCGSVSAAPAAPSTAAVPIAPPAVTGPQAEATGTLQLDVEPRRDLQVFVDGSYVGTADDLGGVLELVAGAYAIEFRAPGHEPLLLDVTLAAHRTIRYRGALQARTQGEHSDAAFPPSDATAPPAGGRSTFYLIPGCYLGDVPPQQARLPQHCDATRVVAFNP